MAQETREETEERESLLKELKELKSTHADLEKEIMKYKENDPVLHEKKGK